MPKKITKEEEKYVLEWIKGHITLAEMARKLKMNPRGTLPYVRVAKVVRKFYNDRVIILTK